MAEVLRGLTYWWRGVDRTFLFTVLALIAVGLILALAASPAAAERVGEDDPFYFLYRQGVYAGLGLFGLLFVSSLDARNARRLGVLALVGALVLMAATLFIGHEVKGAQRWLRIGSFSLQPSEFLKPGLVVTAAWLFAEEKRGAPVPGRLIAVGLFLLGVLLLMLQPDFGQSVLLALVFGGVFFASGLSYAWVVLFGAMTMGGAGLAYLFLPHVASRVDRFLNPETGDSFQVDQARQAIERGGVIGVGPGEGEVKHDLPDAHTDFVFAVAAEEFGLLASLTLIALFSILVARAWTQAMRLTNHFSQLAVSGLALQFALQALINIAVNLNLIPPKGMTLPFISYGGSSMLALAFSAGLVLAFTRRRPGVYAPAYS